MNDHISQPPSRWVGPDANVCLSWLFPFCKEAPHEDEDNALGIHREPCWGESHFLLYVFWEQYFLIKVKFKPCDLGISLLQ